MRAGERGGQGFLWGVASCYKENLRGLDGRKILRFQAGGCNKCFYLCWVKSIEDKSLHMQPYHKTKYTWKGRK